MFVTDIARTISSHLYPGFTAAVTYGGTVYLVSGSERQMQLTDDEIKAIAPEVWPSLLELGRGTAREEMCRRGAIAERRLLQAAVITGVSDRA
jgi:hypothetical protein